MNLADAIRMAKTQENCLETEKNAVSAQETPIDNRFEPRTNTVETSTFTSLGRQAVRLEFSLTTDQLGSLLKAVLSNQHDVLTAKEAAHMLRTTSRSVEELAASGRLNGFKVDGKWKFSRTTLEEWMNKQAGGEAA